MHRIVLHYCFLSRPTGVYNQTYRFCSTIAFHLVQITGGTQVVAGQCRYSYNLDFSMYGGTALTPRTTPLYNYHNGFLASRLSLTDKPFVQTEKSIHNYNSRLPPVHAPGELNFDYPCNSVIKSELEDSHLRIVLLFATLLLYLLLKFFANIH